MKKTSSSYIARDSNIIEAIKNYFGILTIKDKIELLHKRIKEELIDNGYENTYNAILNRNGISLYKRIFDDNKNKIYEDYINEDIENILTKNKVKQIHIKDRRYNI